MWVDTRICGVERVSANTEEDLSRLMDHRGGGGGGIDVTYLFVFPEAPPRKGMRLYTCRLYPPREETLRDADALLDDNASRWSVVTAQHDPRGRRR